jgi:hypothetical protein
MPMLAGIPVATAVIRNLITRVDEPTASQLQLALDARRAVVSLTIRDRERILRALEDCPEELAELRRLLLREHEWRVREGLRV